MSEQEGQPFLRRKHANLFAGKNGNNSPEANSILKKFSRSEKISGDLCFDKTINLVSFRQIIWPISDELFFQLSLI